MTDFTSISSVKMRDVPSGMRSVYFDVSHRVIAGWSISFQSMQPLDVDDSFDARNDQTQRIALFGPKRFAVLRVGDQHIFHRLGHRDAARHACRIGSFGENPGVPAGVTAHSRRSVDSQTPVHSLQLVRP